MVCDPATEMVSDALMPSRSNYDAQGRCAVVLRCASTSAQARTRTCVEWKSFQAPRQLMLTPFELKYSGACYTAGCCTR